MDQTTRPERAVSPTLLSRRRFARRAMLIFVALASIAATGGIVVRHADPASHPTEVAPASVPGTPAPFPTTAPSGTPKATPTAKPARTTPAATRPPPSQAAPRPRVTSGPASPSTRPPISPTPRPPKPPTAPATGPTAPYDPDDH